MRLRYLKAPLRRHTRSLLAFVLVALPYAAGTLDFIEFELIDLRFHALNRAATGGLVLVEIDAPSLRELDSWPWPRSYYAEAAGNLVAAGAHRIAFDLDFSSRSSPSEDRALADVADALGPRLVLPVFSQRVGRLAGRSSIVETRPLPELRRAALASINVVPAADGNVRSMAISQDFAEGALPTLPTLLARREGYAYPFFQIDFGILPATIPRLSFADVLRGRFDPASVAGKQVLVGATAIELGDQLAVPRWITMPGPLLQALAQETLAQDRGLQSVGATPTLVGVLFLLMLVVRPLQRLSWRGGLALCGSMSLVVVLLGFGIYAVAPVLVDITPFVAALMIILGIETVRSLDKQTFQVLIKSVAIANNSRLLKAIIDNSFHGIFVLNSDGTIQTFNRSAERLFGYPAREVLTRDVAMLMPQAEQDGGGRQILAALRLGDSQALAGEPWELVGRRHDGATFNVELAIRVARLQRVQGRRGRQRATEDSLICAARDITARRRLEQAQREAAEKALAASRAKSEFMAMMGHELRTPLNAIIGFSEMMEGEYFGPLGDDKYKGYAQDIHASGSRLLAVLNDILDMSKLDLGDLELNAGLVRPTEMLEACAGMVAEKAAAADVVFAVDFASDLPQLWADEAKLRRSLLNLLSNAVKFTPAGGEVRLSAGRHGDTVIAIEISDTGIGIAPEDLEKAMTPFGQVDSDLNRNYEGTGLGLSLAKSLIELHGGQLELESELGSGTTARIRLPIGPSRSAKVDKDAIVAA